MSRYQITPSVILITALAVLACGGGTERPDTSSAGGSVVKSTPAAADPTGKTIVVHMVTDEKGNYFAPNVIDAARGDVVRFTLTSGVHNVSFPHDSNSIKSGLPKSSDFLQLPGQEYDLAVNMGPGSYYFHCDPHAALGMKGTLNVK
jgi:plastocyanin